MAQPLTYTDGYGLPLTTQSQEAVHWYNQGIRGLLGFRKDTPECFAKALALEPTFAMAHVHLGVHYFLEESADMVARAQACFAQAKTHTAGLTERERDVVETLDLWGTGRVREAIARMHAAIAARPHEIILLQRLYFIYFVQGASDKLRDLPAAVLRHYDHDSYVLGMYSFGLEETQDFARAFETGQQALAYNPEDVWALHALAHASYETGAFVAGTRLLEDGLQHCADVGTFRTHILWHLALFLWDRASISKLSRCITSSSPTPPPSCHPILSTASACSGVSISPASRPPQSGKHSPHPWTRSGTCAPTCSIRCM